MFEGEVLGRLDAGESWGDSRWADEHFDEVGYDDPPATLSDGGVDESRHVLPDLDSIPPGPYLLAILGAVDRSKLNGFDAVRLLRARERMVAHLQPKRSGT
jgi:hypothetical protein